MRRSDPDAATMAQDVLRSFEEDFAWRLHREGQVLSCTAVLLGGGLCGGLTLGLAAVAPLLVGPVKVACGCLAGALGGSQWARRQSQVEQEREGVFTWEVGAQALVAIAGSFPPKPTIRRLKRIVKWAHQLLSRQGALSGEWRLAVFVEVACAFAPWAQRVYFQRRDQGLRYHSLVHLLPLYRFLQRSAAAQVALELCSSLARPGSNGEEKPSGEGAARRCLALATVMQTVSALDSMDEVAYDRLVRGLDVNQETFCSSWMHAVRRRSALGRRQLQSILRAGRAVLRAAEVKESLTSIPPMVLPGDVEVEDDSDEDAEFVSVSNSLRDDGSGYEQRKADFRQGSGEHSWALHDPFHYKLRSETYFSDGSKIPSGEAMLELLDVDAVRIGALGPVVESAKHADFSYRALRRSGETRFLWIWNFVMPPYQTVLTAALDPQAPWLQEASPQARVWRRFLESQPEERKAKLKAIFSVEVGPWALKKVAIKKPTLIGKKIAMASHYVPEDYIEITLDVTNGGRGGGYEEMVTGMVLRHVKSLECGLCCLLEATEQDELPECALFACRVSRVDFGKMIPPVNPE